MKVRAKKDDTAVFFHPHIREEINCLSLSSCPSLPLAASPNYMIIWWGIGSKERLRLLLLRQLTHLFTRRLYASTHYREKLCILGQGKLDQRFSCTGQQMQLWCTYSSFQSIIGFTPIVKKQITDAVQLYCPCLWCPCSPLFAHLWRRHGQPDLSEAGLLNS